MNDLKKWIQIRQDLYQQIESEVRHRLGEDSPELMRYRKTYQEELSRSWEISDTNQLLADIKKSDIVLMGDFHALNQSQKAQMRVLRKIPRSRPLILAVEFFESRHQKDLDLFLKGQLTEKELLKRTRWKERWGFSWDSYRPLVRWAQKNKIAIKAINKMTTNRTEKTLLARDEFAAKKLVQISRKHPESLLFVIYGDLHLASTHIPKALKAAQVGGPFGKVLRIFQNAESIYFKLLEMGVENSTDLIRLSDGSYCLQSVPPWVKWQNYLMYLERAYDVELDEEDDDETEDHGVDYTDHVGRYVRLISEELQLGVGSESLSVYTAEDTSFWTQVNENYSAPARQWIETLIAQEVSFYLPEIESAYLARPTVNHAASLALKYLHAQVTSQKTLQMPSPSTFASLIWLEAVGYFGSKLINHKRKTDTIFDIRASLASKTPHDSGKEALQLALSQKMQELMAMTSGNTPSMAKRTPKKKESYAVAARLLGGMLGERCYGGYRKGLLSGPMWTSFLKKPIETDSFMTVYHDIIELAEALPAPFRSKREKL